MKLPENSVKRARIEIIPLIDVIFFLLATFVMVSLSMVKNEGLFVHLPQASAAKPQVRTSSATITVTEKGELYLNKEKVEPTELSRRLKELKKQDGELHVWINVDEGVPFRLVVKALDEVRGIGIEKVAIQTTH